MYPTSLLYALHDGVEKLVPRAASSPCVFGDLLWCPRTATTRHIMRISFPPRCYFMHEGGYSLPFLPPSSGRGGVSTACTGPRASWRRARVPGYSTVYHTMVSVRLRRAGKFEGVSRSMFGTFGAQIAAPSSSRPNFSAGVPTRFPCSYLLRRFHLSGVSGDP